MLERHNLVPSRCDLVWFTFLWDHIGCLVLNKLLWNAGPRPKQREVAAWIWETVLLWNTVVAPGVVRSGQIWIHFERKINRVYYVTIGLQMKVWCQFLSTPFKKIVTSLKNYEFSVFPLWVTFLCSYSEREQSCYASFSLPWLFEMNIAG